MCKLKLLFNMYLPGELWWMIFLKLESPADLLSCSLASKSWKELIDHDIIWENCYRRKYKEDRQTTAHFLRLEKVNSPTSWKQMYIQTYENISIIHKVIQLSESDFKRLHKNDNTKYKKFINSALDIDTFYALDKSDLSTLPKIWACLEDQILFSKLGELYKYYKELNPTVEDLLYFGFAISGFQYEISTNAVFDEVVPLALEYCNTFNFSIPELDKICQEPTDIENIVMRCKNSFTLQEIQIPTTKKLNVTKEQQIFIGKIVENLLSESDWYYIKARYFESLISSRKAIILESLICQSEPTTTLNMIIFLRNVSAYYWRLNPTDDACKWFMNASWVCLQNLETKMYKNGSVDDKILFKLFCADILNGLGNIAWLAGRRFDAKNYFLRGLEEIETYSYGHITSFLTLDCIQGLFIEENEPIMEYKIREDIFANYHFGWNKSFSDRFFIRVGYRWLHPGSYN